MSIIELSINEVAKNEVAKNGMSKNVASLSIKQIKHIINNLIKNAILSVKSDDWDEVREEIINNLYNIKKFYKIIENYVPCKKKLYISKEQLQKQIQKYLYSLDKFFIKMSDESVIPRKDVGEEEIKEIITLGTKIIIYKQQEKYQYLNFTFCPCPSLPINKKEIEKIEKFIKIEKYRNTEHLYYGMRNTELLEGLNLYKSFIHNTHTCLYETFGDNGGYCHMYSLYKSNDGSIYVLDIWALEYVVSYTLIENEKWFYQGI
jgi:hypothetical protein